MVGPMAGSLCFLQAYDITTVKYLDHGFVIRLSHIASVHAFMYDGAD